MRCAHGATPGTQGRLLQPREQKGLQTMFMWCVQVQVAGQSPNNTANILNATTICNSRVYIVDKVLLPANSTQFIPSPGNGLVIANTSASSNSSAPLFPGLRCVAFAYEPRALPAPATLSSPQDTKGFIETLGILQPVIVACLLHIASTAFREYPP